ncbi:hypothetical protein HGM15179_014961, partial [Zosterops borbonicus]
SFSGLKPFIHQSVLRVGIALGHMQDVELVLAVIQKLCELRVRFGTVVYFKTVDEWKVHEFNMYKCLDKLSNRAYPKLGFDADCCKEPGVRGVVLILSLECGSWWYIRKEGLFVESIQGSAVNDFEAKVKQTFKKHHEIAD